MATPPKVCIDRLLPREQMRFQPTARRGGRVRAIMPIGKLWINGSTLRVRFMGGSTAQRDTAKEQAQWWTQFANLKFDFNNAPDAEIRISFDENDGAWSYIGTDCKGIPVSQATMNLGFLDGGTAGHEFGHAIGMAHEHQNPAGGIEWNEAVVIHDLAGSPNFWNEAMVRHNVLDKYSVDQIKGTQFDPDSIMLYFFPGTWVKSGIGTHANDALSAIDKSFIASAQAYPKTGPVADDAVELQIDAKKRTAASIGKAGEEDIFKFTVAKGGSYAIDTRGPTDVVMKLYGPNSQTDLIAEDDDSGYAYNARIVANLVPGIYHAQVRHYNKASGLGNYTIVVHKQ